MLATSSQGMASLPAKPPSLLSRIDPSGSGIHPMLSGPGVVQPLKRRSIDEEGERPSKRRAFSLGNVQGYPEISAAPWLKGLKDLDNNASREVR